MDGCSPSLSRWYREPVHQTYISALSKKFWTSFSSPRRRPKRSLLQVERLCKSRKFESQSQAMYSRHSWTLLTKETSSVMTLTIWSILDAAEEYDMKNGDDCCSFISSLVNPDNCTETYRSQSKKKHRDLYEKSVKVMTRNLNDVSPMDSFSRP